MNEKQEKEWGAAVAIANRPTTKNTYPNVEISHETLIAANEEIQANRVSAAELVSKFKSIASMQCDMIAASRVMAEELDKQIKELT